MRITPRQVQLALAGVGAFVGVLLLSRRASREGGEGDGGGWGPFEPGESKPPVDDYATHDPASAGEKSLSAKPGVLKFREWAIARWGERAGSPQNIVADKAGEHSQGRAWDLMVNNKAHGQQVVDELLAPENGVPDALARRAGIMFMIWNRQIWRAYAWQGQPSGTWGPYSGASTHEDHIHFSFGWPGARAETSLYAMIEPTPIA